VTPVPGPNQTADRPHPAAATLHRLTPTAEAIARTETAVQEMVPVQGSRAGHRDHAPPDSARPSPGVIHKGADTKGLSGPPLFLLVGATNTQLSRPSPAGTGSRAAGSSPATRPRTNNCRPASASSSRERVQLAFRIATRLLPSRTSPISTNRGVEKLAAGIIVKMKMSSSGSSRRQIASIELWFAGGKRTIVKMKWRVPDSGEAGATHERPAALAGGHGNFTHSESAQTRPGRSQTGQSGACAERALQHASPQRRHSASLTLGS
jgi:hypothetical protein